jgi:hypothetical protein
MTGNLIIIPERSSLIQERFDFVTYSQKFVEYNI